MCSLLMVVDLHDLTIPMLSCGQKEMLCCNSVATWCGHVSKTNMNWMKQKHGQFDDRRS